MINDPLLTISIPTYNRSYLLKELLEVLTIQINALGNSSLVEIIVLDNNSTDNTGNVVQTIQKECSFISYYKNDTNIGGNNNILKGPFEFAKGKYCLIIGDDDLLRDNALSEICKCIKNNDTDIIYLNQTYENLQDRSVLKLDGYDADKALLKNFANGLLVNAQVILDFSPKFPSLFTSVSSMIFKTSVWKKNFIGYQSQDFFNSLNNTFPHSAILSKSLVKNKVYYFGYPYLAFTVGAQEWVSNWKYLNFIRMLDLSDLFEKHGAGKSFLKKYRKGIFESSADAYFQLLANKNNEFRKYLNNKRLVNKYITDKTFVLLLFSVYKRLSKHYLKNLSKGLFKNKR